MNTVFHILNFSAGLCRPLGERLVAMWIWPAGRSLCPTDVECVFLCAAETQRLAGVSWFGHGGSGAPIKDAHGNLLTDYSSRRVSTWFVHSLLSLSCRQFLPCWWGLLQWVLFSLLFKLREIILHVTANSFLFRIKYSSFYRSSKN